MSLISLLNIQERTRKNNCCDKRRKHSNLKGVHWVNCSTVTRGSRKKGNYSTININILWGLFIVLPPHPEGFFRFRIWSAVPILNETFGTRRPIARKSFDVNWIYAKVCFKTGHIFWKFVLFSFTFSSFPSESLCIDQDALHKATKMHCASGLLAATVVIVSEFLGSVGRV